MLSQCCVVFWTNRKRPGGTPVTKSLDALFEHEYFDYQYKLKVWSQASTHAARSLNEAYATRYDYIFVFDNYIKRTFDQITGYLESKNHVKPMQGKLIFLADYHPSARKRQISSPTAGTRRDNWRGTVADIKLAFRGFLTQEFDWKQPPRGISNLTRQTTS